jgi:thiol-disulfide isomerase/thioredoxin
LQVKSRIWKAVIGCVLVLAATPSWAAAESKTQVLPACGQARIGEQAPWLSGWTLDEKVFNIRKPFESGENSRLALVFWATWCKPCVKGLERLTESAAALEEAGIAVVLVNVGERKEKVLEFFMESEPPFLVVLDPYQVSCDSYLRRPSGEWALPFTALINPDGVVERLLGAEGDDYIERMLEME